MQNSECSKQSPRIENDDAARRNAARASRRLDVYQVLVECRDEDEQRELFERLKQDGRKVRLLVL